MIREIGEVVAGGKTAMVKIDRKKECDGCKMCSRRRGDNYVKMRADNALGAKVGDKVEVRIEKAFTLQASALVYLLPLLCATIGLLVGFFTLNEKYAFGLCLIMLVVGYIIVVAVDRLLRKNKAFTPVVTAIITPKKESDENE